MKTKSLVIALSFVLTFITLAWAEGTRGRSASFNAVNSGGLLLPQAQNSNQPEIPAYVPGQLIVKLRDGRSLGELKQLNARYNVSSSEKVFPDSRKPEILLTQLKNKLESLSVKHESWYWQLDKNSPEYKAYAEKLAKEKSALENKIKTLEGVIAHKRLRQERTGKKTAPPALDNYYLLRFSSSDDIEKIIAQYRQHPAVENAGPNRLYKLLTPAYPEPYQPQDPLYAPRDADGYIGQWGHPKTHTDSAWTITRGIQDVVIAIIDTGVDYRHEDLSANIWHDVEGNPGRDFVNLSEEDLKNIPSTGSDGTYKYIYSLAAEEDYQVEDNDPSDVAGHGTYCAGVAAARGNTLGVIGVCPECRIMPLRSGYAVKVTVIEIASGKEVASYLTGYVDLVAAAKAIEYAADQGADIASMSFGDYYQDPALKDVIGCAYSQGVLLFAASGNDNKIYPTFPASFENVISLGSTDKNDAKSSFSNYGPWLDIMAPGEGIISTLPTAKGKYYTGNYMNGTSFSSPYAAGLAGLMLSVNPEIPVPIARQLLENTADDLGEPGKDKFYGAGRINGYWAVRAAQGPLITSLPENSFVKGRVELRSLPLSEKHFDHYEIYLAPCANPAGAVKIASSDLLPPDGLLAEWDTGGFPDGDYLLTQKVYLTPEKKVETSLKVTIDNENTPALFKPIDNQGVVIGNQLAFKVEAFDPDDPQGPYFSSISYSVDSRTLPSGASFDPATQIFSWQPSEDQKGEYNVEFIAGDGQITARLGVTVSTILKRVRFFPITYNMVGGGVGDYLVLDKSFLAWEEIEVPRDYHCYYTLFAQRLTDPAEEKITLVSHQRDLMSCPEFYDGKLAYLTPDPKKWGSTYSLQINIDDLEQGNNILRYTNGSSPTMLTNPIQMFGDNLIMTEVGAAPESALVSKYSISRSSKEPLFTRSNLWFLNGFYQNTLVYSVFLENLFKVAAYDISRGRELVLENNGFDQGAYPVIQGTKILRHCYEESGVYEPKQCLKVFDLATNQDTRIEATINYMYKNYALFDNRVVWQNAEMTKLYLYDLLLRQRTELVPNGTAQYPKLYQDNVAWYNIGRNVIEVDQHYFVPRIVGLSATVLAGGDSFIVRGYNFGYERDPEAKVVFANGVVATIVSWSNAEITCTVPAGAVSGEVKVVTPGGQSKGIYLEVSGRETYIAGDVSGEAGITAYDANLAMRLALNPSLVLTPEESTLSAADQRRAADVNGDGSVSLIDAALIAQRAVGLISKFPRE